MAKKDSSSGSSGKNVGDSAAIPQDKFSRRAKRAVVRGDDANTYKDGGTVRGMGAAQRGGKYVID